MKSKISLFKNRQYLSEKKYMCFTLKQNSCTSIEREKNSYKLNIPPPSPANHFSDNTYKGTFHTEMAEKLRQLLSVDQPGIKVGKTCAFQKVCKVFLNAINCLIFSHSLLHSRQFFWDVNQRFSPTHEKSNNLN